MSGQVWRCRSTPTPSLRAICLRSIALNADAIVNLDGVAEITCVELLALILSYEKLTPVIARCFWNTECAFVRKWLKENISADAMQLATELRFGDGRVTMR